MCDVPKHHSEKEGEGDACKNGRIDFLVHRDTICVDNLLEAPSEVIGLDEGRGRNVVLKELLEISCRVSL